MSALLHTLPNAEARRFLNYFSLPKMLTWVSKTAMEQRRCLGQRDPEMKHSSSYCFEKAPVLISKTLLAEHRYPGRQGTEKSVLRDYCSKEVPKPIPEIDLAGGHYIGPWPVAIKPPPICCSAVVRMSIPQKIKATIVPGNRQRRPSHLPDVDRQRC